VCRWIRSFLFDIICLTHLDSPSWFARPKLICWDMAVHVSRIQGEKVSVLDLNLTASIITCSKRTHYPAAKRSAPPG